MPRTKQPKKQHVAPAIPVSIRQYEAQFDAQIELVKEAQDIALKELETHLKQQKLLLSHRLLNMTVDELRAGKYAESTLCDPSSLSSIINSTTSTTSKKPINLKRSLSMVEDEAGSNTSSESRTRTLRQTKMQPKSTRVSRSLSRSKTQKPAQTFSAYKTPLSKARPVCFGTITPKMKPNTPQVVLRRPKQGEMAVSMQGSPLLVGGTVNDEVANVNIPLQDGRIVSIQPQRGLRVSQLPELDPSTKRQIEALRDNLNKLMMSASSR